MASYQISNFVPCVREALSAIKVSHFAVLRNVNSVLGNMVKTGVATVKNGRLSINKNGAKASVNESHKFTTKDVYIQHKFALWHQAIEVADKLNTIPSIELPEVFRYWLTHLESVQAVQADSKIEAIVNSETGEVTSE